MTPTRRQFLKTLLATPLAMTLDVEKLLWVPGQQIAVPDLVTAGRGDLVWLDDIMRPMGPHIVRRARALRQMDIGHFGRDTRTRIAGVIAEPVQPGQITDVVVYGVAPAQVELRW